MASLSWYEKFDELWENFISSQSEMNLLKLKEFIELDINKSIEDFDTFSKEILKEYPNRQIFLNENENIDPNPCYSWLSEHDSPIFEKSGTDAGYIILKWMDVNYKENTSCYDIELTRFLGKCFSHNIYIVNTMCDSASSGGNLVLLINLHTIGVEGFYEIDNALYSNNLEILKYLYYDRNTFLDVSLVSFAYNQNSDVKDFIKEVGEDWKKGIFLNLNVKPAKHNK
jgi:hypothetical protein